MKIKRVTTTIFLSRQRKLRQGDQKWLTVARWTIYFLSQLSSTPPWRASHTIWIMWANQYATSQLYLTITFSKSNLCNKSHFIRIKTQCLFEIVYLWVLISPPLYGRIDNFDNNPSVQCQSLASCNFTRYLFSKKKLYTISQILNPLTFAAKHGNLLNLSMILSSLFSS